MFGIEFIKKSCNLLKHNSLVDWTIKSIPSYLNTQLLSALQKEYDKRSLSLLDNWELTARNNQKLPDGNWFGWLILAGRGFGKTRAGAEGIKKLVLSGHYKRIALIGETYDQIRSVMLEGESGLLNLHYGEDNSPTYISSKRQLQWPNGAIATFYSAENPEHLRGPQFDLAWIDELAKFDNAQKVWDQLMFCLRLGKNPKVIITTTPRSKDIIFNLTKRNDIHVTRGNTFENSENLSPTFLQMIKNEYSDTKFGNQEIFGELLSKDDSQLWSHCDFIYQEISQKLINEMEIIIAIDPAMTAKESSDETGIIVAGYLNNKFYILEDASGRMHCNLWMKKASDLYHKYNANKILIETNQGGDVLMSMLKSFEDLPFKSMRAKIDKYSRAIPISALYQQKKVIHAKHFSDLEEQLIKSHLNFKDDRLDALTWALFELNQENNIIKEDNNGFGFF